MSLLYIPNHRGSMVTKIKLTFLFHLENLHKTKSITVSDTTRLDEYDASKRI